MNDHSDIEAAEEIRKEMLTTKEDLLTWIEKQKIFMQERAQGDKKHSAGFYSAYMRLLDRFKDEIESTHLFNRLEDFWYYAVCVSSAGASLSLEYSPRYHYDEEGKIHLQIGQSLELLNVEGKMLSVEEYANEFGVGAGTVRQWIRRGKIRNARKVGNEWVIPELTELPGRGYKPAYFLATEKPKNIPEEYGFLGEYPRVLIFQDTEDKNLYNVIAMAQGKKSLEVQMNLTERERFELYLIANPDFIFVEGPKDGLNLKMSSKDSVGAFFE